MAIRLIILLNTIGTDELLLEEHTAKMVDKAPLSKNPKIKKTNNHTNK